MIAEQHHPLDCPLCDNRMVFSPDCSEIGCNHCKARASTGEPQPVVEYAPITVTKRTLNDGRVILE